MTTATRPAPTEEQLVALEKFATGDDLVIEAGAGTGKTSTLVELAHSPRGAARRGQYVAFNKGIVSEAGGKLGSHVAANTAHSLAFRAVGHAFGSRLRSGARMRSSELARATGASKVVLADKVLGPGLVASIATRAVVRFCQSADETLSERHVPFQEGLVLEAGGADEWAAQRALRAAVLPVAERIWADACDPGGRLPYRHDYYLKLWERSSPIVAADYVLFDEAQDASPVLKSVVEQQTGAQLVWVGDSNQQIYAFTGAVNALAGVPGQRTWLTQSFRFGPAIADVANDVLAGLPTELRLVGAGPVDSRVGPVDVPAAVLTRTNAAAVRRFVAEKAAGRDPHLVGGGAELVRFARAATELATRGWTSHPELACFKSWSEVQAYVEGDAQGDELRLAVRLVDDFGAETLVAELERMTPAARAGLVISTAHKSKGLAWSSVALGSDFPAGDKRGEDERRLLYVAVTRARRALDLGGNDPLARGGGELT